MRRGMILVALLGALVAGALAVPTIDLRNLPAVTNDAYYPLFRDAHRHLSLMGGANSGKSYFAARKCLVRLVSEPGHRIIVIRKVARTARQSTFAEVMGAIGAWGWQDLFRAHRSDLIITYRGNGGELIFLGLDDAEKLKSIHGVTSAWVEEATEITEAEYNQINLRIRGTTAGYKQIITTYNPVSSRSWLRSRFWERADESVRTLRTTYRDNRYIDPDDARELEALAELDPVMHAIYARGEWGVLEGQVYAPPDLDTPWPASFGETIYGLDFGFNNPSALVEENIRDGEAYEREVLYESRLTTADLVARLESLAIPKRAAIYADAAEPGRIEEIRRAGYDVRPADKGQGSVNAGIAFVRSLKVHGRRDNVNLNAELDGYVWRKDRDGKPMDEPVKFNDHLMDARRYALWTHLGARRSREPRFG